MAGWHLTVFSNAGGGGERVLWAAIRATQLRWPNAICVVYTGDRDASRDNMLNRVRERFDIELNPQTVHFLYLSTRKYVLASTWPHFTLIGQSLGSLILGLDAFLLLTPDVFVDTMGYAFVLYLSKLLFPKVPTGAYVHYPTISTDMLDSLEAEAETGKGLNAGAGKGLRGQLKKRYWRLFASAYSHVGRSVDIVMTNSSWTQGHIQQLWGAGRKSKGTSSEIKVVFPPVAVEEMEEKITVNQETEGSRQPHLLYIAQFRPEKNHTLILQAFAKFAQQQKSKVSISSKKQPRLVLVGSVRDDADSKRVYKLRLMANELQVKDQVDFVCDATWPQVLDQLRSSSVGVNGMWNEHFGIGVVEYQAAGLISVVNNSGGPKLDIVVDIDGKPTGKWNPLVLTRTGVWSLTSQVTMPPRSTSMLQVSSKLYRSVAQKLPKCVCEHEKARNDSLKKSSRRSG